MALKAVLKIDGKSYNLLDAHYNFTRYTDHSGYVTNLVRFHQIQLVFAADADVFFLQWMFKPELQKSGSISFYEDEDKIKKVKKVIFAGAFCVHYQEKFNAFNTKPFLTYLTLSAGGVKIEEGVFRFPWFRGPLKAEEEKIMNTVVEYLPSEPKEKISNSNKSNKPEPQIVSTPTTSSAPSSAALVTPAIIPPVIPASPTPLTLPAFVASFRGDMSTIDKVEATKAMNLYLSAQSSLNAGDKAKCIADSKEIEKIFNTQKWNVNEGICWPPMNGGFNHTKKQFNVGDKFDRYHVISSSYLKNYNHGTTYSTATVLVGSFTSPIPPPPKGKYAYIERAIVGKEEDYHLTFDMEILEPMPIGYEVADIIPWHGYDGLGKQAMFDLKSADPTLNTIGKLQHAGYIEIREIKSPNKSFDVVDNTTLIYK